MVKKKLIWIIPALFLSGCGDSGPDYGPVGDGMKSIAICLVVCAVVKALAELVLSQNDKDREVRKKRQRRDQSKGGKP